MNNFVAALAFQRLQRLERIEETDCCRERISSGGEKVGFVFDCSPDGTLLDHIPVGHAL